ncbi:ABC-type multidrug transport system fused ATPase/permease subunit [Streptomyces sp. 1114.5]|uniref:ABC transporter transmembrane domain-containing protein n=1 Tax=unclassified Streptomyces TaxID=2593676 RepID=UPI000BCD4DD0|nr:MULTISPECIES: ABC transporter ATP-binding protein [unclassified Streptomyces]RKT12298.1 ABC-type multidrug transport system fused ATPase/permease subunit [Streptomyces sp. 1114.5]SOB79491.1 ABC-type multidrug transport system, ATPase and permease component [Streptomyces sp. 1331.2]
MRDFFDRPPGTPDLRGPWRYLLWMAVRHRGVLLLDCLANMGWAAGLGLTPAVIGQAINQGLVARDQTALVGWGLAVLGAGVLSALSAMFVERLETRLRVEPGYETMQFVTRKACELGTTVGRKVSAGDLVTVGVSDISLIGQALEVGARGVGGVVGFVAVAVFMLVASWQVGLLVLVAVPVMLVVTTRLARVLRNRQGQLRTHQRELADQAVDIVRGLRVLRGIGGEEQFAARYREGSQRLRATALRQGRASAVLGATRTFLPSLLLAAVVALAGELVLDDRLSAGQMVAFYGYATYLVIPTNQITFAVSKAMQGHVAAENVVRLLRTVPDLAPGPDTGTVPGTGVLADPDSGLRVPAEGLTAVVCSSADAVALADRLGRQTDSAATYADVPLTALPLAGVRERILVATAEDHLFAGPLRRELDPADRLRPGDPDDALWAAVDAAAARDVVEALPDRLDTEIAAGGREFSGGQQQRLRLARALMADPEVLVLIDPTSAVDAHTENRMAEGIARLRRGRATVVFTTSTLLLHQADHVALVLDGGVTAEGTHEALMADDRYRELVERWTAAA